MRYFWHFLGVAGFIVVITVLFFAFSLNAKDNITFTDEQRLTEPTVTIADPAVGPATAPVTIVNFGDYQCQTCGDLEQSLATLRERYPNELRIVWKDMPNTSAHPEALDAAIAAHCAGEQDAFWEYHAYLMANQDLLSAELYTELATQLGLREQRFTRCVEDRDTLPLVQRGFEEGVALGITATPTIYINNQRYTGSITTSELRGIIDRLIADL